MFYIALVEYVNKDYLWIVDYQYTWWTILGFGYCRNADRSHAFSVRKSARTGVTSLVRHLSGRSGSGSTYSRKDSKDVGGKSSPHTVVIPIEDPVIRAQSPLRLLHHEGQDNSPFRLQQESYH